MTVNWSVKLLTLTLVLTEDVWSFFPVSVFSSQKLELFAIFLLQSQKGNDSTSGASTPSAAEAAHTDVAADSRRPADIQPTAPSDEVISQPSSVSQAPDSAPKRKRSKDEDPNLLQNSDEFSRFGQTVADMLRRLPKERRDQAMFHIHKVLLEQQNPWTSVCYCKHYLHFDILTSVSDALSVQTCDIVSTALVTFMMKIWHQRRKPF